MNNFLSTDHVQRIAMLSRLECSDGEIEHYAKDLNRILQHIEQLNELNTEGIEPTAHALRLVNVFREDEPQASLSNDQALANAPDKEQGHFKVPQIIQEQS